MKNRVEIALILAGAVIFPATTGRAARQNEQSPAEVARAKEKVQNYLNTKNATARNPSTVWIDSPDLKKAFPGFTFFAVRFRQYPVAIAPPPGMKSANVFAVGSNNEFLFIDDPQVLERFFVTFSKKDDVLVPAWLRLSEELVQDGFYKFQILDKIDHGPNDAWIGGRSIVMAGGNGEIHAKIIFVDGKVSKVEQTVKLRPGPRPKCQATKLLDTDPIVRFMAESELLYMGLAARPYLQEQRVRANPALREAIDRLLRRIEAEGW